jgi:hypothetical protein
MEFDFFHLDQGCANPPAEDSRVVGEYTKRIFVNLVAIKGSAACR